MPVIKTFGNQPTTRNTVASTIPQKPSQLRSRVVLEVYDYPGGTHQWPGRQGDAGIAEAAAFLRRHLR